MNTHASHLGIVVALVGCGHDRARDPYSVAIAPNGELWVTDTENGKLVFFDAASGAKLGELAAGTV